MTDQSSIDPFSSSILTSIKHNLGITEGYTHFDVDVVMHINSVFSTLTQLGVGPEEGFSISGSSTTWADYLKNDDQLNFVTSYMYLKVRMLFDPPSNGTVMNAMNETVRELEWRINSAVDSWGSHV